MLLSTDATTRWQCLRSADFALRAWPDGSVLFDEANGQLHFLTPVAGMLLRLFMQRPAWSVEELAATLLDTRPTAEDIDLVNQVLVNFRSLKLIDRTPD